MYFIPRSMESNQEGFKQEQLDLFYILTDGCRCYIKNGLFYTAVETDRAVTESHQIPDGLSQGDGQRDVSGQSKSIWGQLIDSMYWGQGHWVKHQMENNPIYYNGVTGG